MKKTTQLFVICIVLLTPLTLNAQSVFVLQNGSRALFYTNMSDVMSNYQNGDTLYLPPKPIDGNFTFNKKVTIIGAGYHPDTAAVTGISKVTGYIEFSPGSKGASITGVRTEGHIYLHDSIISVIRCSMANLYIQNNTKPMSQIYIGDCEIRGAIDGSNSGVTNSLIERCVVYGNISGGDKTNNLMIKNCVLLYNNNYFLDGVASMIVQNSIILNTYSYVFNGTTDITFKNNLFVRGAFSPVNFSMSGNLFSIPEVDIFVNKANGDYHIKPTLTQAFTLATDGKQVGIYGTDYPFLVPTYAPRFISIDNAEKIVNGKLSVKMKVEARDR